MSGIQGAALKELVQRLVRAMDAHGVSRNAATLSYYFLFSLFPLLFCVVALAAYLPIEGIIEQMMDRLRPLIPADAMSVVEGHVSSLLQHRPKLMTFSVLTALWAASRGVNSLRAALNLAYEVKETRPFWKTQGAALLVTVSGIVLALATVAMVFVGSDFALWFSEHFGLGGRTLVGLFSWLRWPLTTGMLMLAVGWAYHWLPDVNRPFRYFTPGSLFGTFAWLVATWGFTQYVNHFGKFNVTYGTIGGVMILLTWLYLSAWVFIAGGEINALWDAKRLSARDPFLHGRKSDASRV